MGPILLALTAPHKKREKMKTIKYILIIMLLRMRLIVKQWLLAIYAIAVCFPLLAFDYYFGIPPKVIKWTIVLINYPISWISGIFYVVYIAANSTRNKFKTLWRAKFYLVDDLEPIEMLHIYECPDGSLSPYGWYFWSYGDRYFVQEDLLREKGSYTFLERELRVLKSAIQQEYRDLIPWIYSD